MEGKHPPTSPPGKLYTPQGSSPCFHIREEIWETLISKSLQLKVWKVDPKHQHHQGLVRNAEFQVLPQSF